MKLQTAISPFPKALRAWTASKHHKVGMKWAGEMAGVSLAKGILKGGFGSKLGFLLAASAPAITLLDAYQGYREGGIWGATKSAASTIALTGYKFGAQFSMATTALGYGAIGAAGIAAVGYTAGIRGFHLMRPYTNEFKRRMERVEMGSPVIDSYGNAATMRQRSLMAIQNSKINGRSALGNEAQIFHRSYFR